MKTGVWTVLLLAGLPLAAAGQRPYVAKQLPEAAGDSVVRVIVQFKGDLKPAHRQLVERFGGRAGSEFHTIHAGSFAIAGNRVAALAQDPNVAAIWPDRRVRSMLDNTTAAVNAAAAWNAGLDGSGMAVAMIDSGISPHDDLGVDGNSRIVYSESFVGEDGTDRFGHGEHVAGILGGTGSDAQCGSCTRLFRGMAPKVNLVNLQALDGTGQGSDSSVIAAIERAIELKAQYNIRVINLSLGREAYESFVQDPLCQAVEAAWRAGIVVVVAAGNDGRINPVGNNGYGTITAPGNDPFVITVGAMKAMGTPGRADDLVASYSSKGPSPVDHIVKPDLVAPGNLVVSLLSPNGSLQSEYPANQVPLSYYEQTESTALSTSYFTLSGTSMATPVVSGAAILLLQAHPKMTPDQVKARLMLTAYKGFPATSVATDAVTGMSYTSEYDVFTVGAGYLDVEAALADATTFRGSALSPVAIYSAASGTATIACVSNTICSALASKGNASAWSSQAVWGRQAITGTQSIWGDQTMWGDQSVWSIQSIWSDQSIWNAGMADSAEAIGIAIRGEQ